MVKIKMSMVSYGPCELGNEGWRHIQVDQVGQPFGLLSKSMPLYSLLPVYLRITGVLKRIMTHHVI